PHTLKLVDDLREHAGLPAVVSGAGPTVLVLCATASDAAEPRSPEITRQVDSIRRRAGNNWDIRPLQIEPAGVRTPSPHPWYLCGGVAVASADVRLGEAPDAPLRGVCSSATSALASDTPAVRSCDRPEAVAEVASLRIPGTVPSISRRPLLLG